MSNVAALMIVMVSGTATTSMAQAAKNAPKARMAPPQETMKDHQGMGMSGMSTSPHHLLALAYRDNVATFAKALRMQVMQSKIVDLDLARPAMLEMRRSYDQLKQHDEAQMKATGDHEKSPMSNTTKDMQTHLTALGEHLTMLETALYASVPDPRDVAAHAAEILKQCAGLSAMHAKDAPQRMQSHG